MNRSQSYAAIQSISIKGDILQNVKRHVALVKAAVEHGAQFVLFPELSLTGYELSIAREVSVTSNDPRLDALRSQAQELGVTIVAGAPYLDESGALLIAAFVFSPDGRIGVHSKQYLHSGEAEVFTPGKGGELLDIHEEKIALAICADISCSDHARHAAESGATVYAASVLITSKGYDVDTALLKQYAQGHRMPVLMSNHGGATGGWESAGRSAAWSADGELVVAAAGDGECIVIARQENGNWHGEVIQGAT